MRVVIPAAGEGVRWRHYHHKRVDQERAGFRKHFAEFDGEAVIARTIRQFTERGVDDIWVVGKDAEYDLPGAELFIPIQIPEHYDANKILNSSALWHPTDPTIVAYGDVYFTDDAVNRMIAEPRDWTAFGRWTRHKCTKSPGELFAFKFDAEHADRNRQVLLQIAGMVRRGELKRAAGWEFYWTWCGNPHAWGVIHEYWHEIDDMTDDIDTPQQYEDLKRCVGQS